MSKRLQVLLSEQEYKRIQKEARKRNMTLGAWVREVLREGEKEQSSRLPREKLKALQKAIRHSYPTADIDQMLEEIESGYTDHTP